MAAYSDKILQEKLSLLQQETGKICITIILPASRQDSRINRLHTEKIVHQMTSALGTEYGRDADILTASLNRLFNQLDFERLEEGFGFYVSEKVEFMLHFPFPVIEKVMADRMFDLRDLLYLRQLAHPYFALHVSEKTAHLYAASLRDLEESNDAHFPFEYEDDHEYSPPSRGSSYYGNAFQKSFEQDTSEMQKIRFSTFMKQVDKKLGHYLTGPEKLVVVGARRNTAAFLNRSEHSEKLIGVVSGNYEMAGVYQLSLLVWPVMYAWLIEQMKDAIGDYTEKIGEGLAVEGLVNVWDAVAEGRGEMLLVEKDYRTPGFVIRNFNDHLYLQPPSRSYNILPDAVNALIAMTLDKNGSVKFVNNGMLNDHQHIALVTRY
ncbi:MAG TPA: hypothetical protein VFZ78_12375 [Flavisolibacter sp.]